MYSMYVYTVYVRECIWQSDKFHRLSNVIDNWWLKVLSLQQGWTQRGTNSGCCSCNQAVQKVIVLLRPLGLWGDTPLPYSWLVRLFYLGLHGSGHWLEYCFSAHTALRGSDLNTSNKPARTSATAVEDWKHTSLLIIDGPTVKVKERQCLGGGRQRKKNSLAIDVQMDLIKWTKIQLATVNT